MKPDAPGEPGALMAINPEVDIVQDNKTFYKNIRVQDTLTGGWTG